MSIVTRTGRPLRAVHNISMEREWARPYETPSEFALTRLDSSLNQSDARGNVQKKVSQFEALALFHHTEIFPNFKRGTSSSACRLDTHGIESRSPLSLNDGSAPNDPKLINDLLDEKFFEQRQFIEEKLQEMELQLSRQMSQKLHVMQSQLKLCDKLRYIETVKL